MPTPAAMWVNLKNMTLCERILTQKDVCSRILFLCNVQEEETDGNRKPTDGLSRTELEEEMETGCFVDYFEVMKISAVGKCRNCN